MAGQSINDRLTAARYSLAGQGLAKSVCKATTEEVIGPKKKHLDCEYTSQHFPPLVPLRVDVRAFHTERVSRRLFIDLESMNMMAALRWEPLGLLFCVYLLRVSNIHRCEASYLDSKNTCVTTRDLNGEF